MNKTYFNIIVRNYHLLFFYFSLTIADRLKKMDDDNKFTVKESYTGSKNISFVLKNKSKKELAEEKNDQHQKHRKNVVRSTKSLRGKFKLK